MWELLPTPHNSIAVWRLVGDAWGQLSFADIVSIHERSVTFGYLVGNEIIALFNVIPIEAMHSARLNLWLQPSWQRKRGRYEVIAQLWSEGLGLIFNKLGIKVLIATTRSRSVARLAIRYGARQGDVVKNLYGEAKHGYNVIWD